LRDANLPPTAPPAPDLTGLDPKSAMTVQRTEGMLLRANYDALLRVVKDQNALNMSLKQRMDEIEMASKELKTTYELKVNSNANNEYIKAKPQLIGVINAL